MSGIDCLLDSNILIGLLNGDAAMLVWCNYSRPALRHPAAPISGVYLQWQSACECEHSGVAQNTSCGGN